MNPASAIVRRPGAAWWLLAALLAIAALGGWPIPHESLDWQPALATREPWRAFSAVAVHYSALHLGANLAGALVVALLGWAAAAPAAWTWAWFAAWPLTQFGLLLEPGLLHYGGLSGVLHAGVAVVAVGLAWPSSGPGRVRRGAIGWALAIGLVAKLLHELPWGGALRHPAGWDIAIAPFAHVSGAVAGLVCALVANAVARQRSPA